MSNEPRIASPAEIKAAVRELFVPFLAKDGERPSGQARVLIRQSSWLGADGNIHVGPTIVHPDYERLTGRKPPKGSIMSDPSNEDTTQIDRELIANDLDTVAKLAGRLGYPDMATEIGALAAKYRKPADAQD